ncbi:serine protease [Sphingobacterium sp. DR205]|uniref:S1 family peptidase n=1 Tax=Sphingobacterium sp. DR205 TaxID=2713573 RepID=UPI0013E4A29B|nr:serine protease [Sphingobacterium sp. DR205]QIH35920.1 trypsin-like peptidase domain-containing protein [Sphingobacterium sp. DR205]
MKLKKYIIGVALCSLFISKIYAQEFIVNEQLISKFEKSADSLIKVNQSISVTECKKILGKKFEKVNLSLNKQKNKKLSPNTIYETAKHATVMIGAAYLCPNCEKTHVNIASGYIIQSEGVIVTNYHVVNAYANMREGYKPLAFMVRLFNGKTFPIKEIIALSQKDDLAILKIQTNGDKLPALSLSKGAKIGEPAFVIGHPHNMNYHFSQGNVNYKFSDQIQLEGKQDRRDIMLISADYGVGSSGGPVLNENGNVIGTVSSTKTLSHYENPSSIQMVLKKTIPVESLLNMINQ